MRANRQTLRLSGAFAWQLEDLALSHQALPPAIPLLSFLRIAFLISLPSLGQGSNLMSMGVRARPASSGF
jgi:hypothetical protein